MEPVRIMVVFGTRPEAIKLAPVIGALKADPLFRVAVAVTAQHRDMLDQALEAFAITPDFDLDIMRRSQTLTQLTTRMLTKLGALFGAQRPAMVLVHGDTTTTFAASLAAFYRRIPVAHVEAGLRTSDKYAPFPEEINRRLTGALCDLHFAPTPHAKDNLLKEGVPERRIFVTGNTVIDALAQTADPRHAFGDAALRGMDWTRRVLLLTCHRRENQGERMRRIFAAVKKIAQAHADCRIVFPVHPNDKVRRPAREMLGDVPGVLLTAPLSYADMVNLMSRCCFALTDSGGIQEEAVALGKPVLVLRDATERSEAVDCGAAKLVGTETDGIVREAGRLLGDPAAYARMAGAPNPFGDGRASERITRLLADHFTE